MQSYKFHITSAMPRHEVGEPELTIIDVHVVAEVYSVIVSISTHTQDNN